MVTATWAVADRSGPQADAVLHPASSRPASAQTSIHGPRKVPPSRVQASVPAPASPRPRCGCEDGAARPSSSAWRYYQGSSAPPVPSPAQAPSAAPTASGLGAGAVSANLSGLTFSASGDFSPCPDCLDGLEAIQVFWGTRRNDGVQVGQFQTVFPPLAATYDSFVDGGRNSPGGATYSGENPYYIGRPDLPGSYGYNPSMGSAGSVSGCVASPFDAPGAAALHQEAYFETAFVCLNFRGSGQDEITKSVQWGFDQLGTVPKAHPRTTDPGPIVRGSPSAEFGNTLRADYPAYPF